jgi:hypothetical protein
MLADLEPHEHIELEAATRLDPWGDDWQQTAKILELLHNANFSSDSMHWTEFIPNEENRQASDEVGPAELAAAARSLAGL